MLDLLGRFQKASLGGDASRRCRHSVLILENFTHSQKILMSKLGLKLFPGAGSTKPPSPVSPLPHLHSPLGSSVL